MAGIVFHYADLPNSNELCCIVAEIDLSETKDSSAKSHFHWKTMKCRLIIHTMQDAVIATPVYETISSIHVIVGVEFFKTRVLQNTLKELSMTWSTPKPVTPDVYANCLKYSFLFALAPRWNRVGQFLINDKEFLTAAETSTAVKFNLTLQNKCEGTKACLRIQPFNVRLLEQTLKGFGLSDDFIADFMAESDGKVDMTLFGNHRVTVLPSLKRGKLMSIMKKIPALSPFKNYGELRRHWKNMYGYRLPATDAGLLYFEVYFPMPMAERFLYPNICVRSRILETPYFGNRDLLVQSFLQDIHRSFPMICGHPLKIVENGEKIESPLFISASSIQKVEGRLKIEPKTPERMKNVETIHGNSITRLSMSCLTPKNELRRDASTLMSPTPSLRGALSIDEERSDKLRGILSTIARFRQNVAAPSMPRIKEFPGETKNQCSNVETAGENINPNEASQVSPMDIDSNESFVFMPRSKSDASSQTEKKFRKPVKPLQEPSTSNHNAEMKNRDKTESSEVSSKYFGATGNSNQRMDQKVSQVPRNATIRERLLRNKMNDQKMSEY